MPYSTFLLADLVGYTALTEAMGDEQAADIATEFLNAARPLLAEYGAEEVKTVGDALLVRVPDAGPAIHLAARLTRELGNRHRSLGIRVGVHTGSAVERAGDWFGSAVNIAARVAEQAQPGEVVLTAATLEAAGTAVVPGQVLSRGEPKLKNVAEPLELLALVLGSPEGDRRLPVDPVCRMAVDPEAGGPSLTREGVELHFCSSACLDAFAGDPERYG